MTQSNVKVFASADRLAGYFASLLKELTSRSNLQPYVSIALSGGSTPRAVFEYMSLNGDRIDWEKLRLFWGDERCVGPDHPDSNFRMVQQSLLGHVSIQESNVFRIRGEDDPAMEAARYASVVAQGLTPYDGIPQFDLVMLGMGDDGHTASVFPGDEQVLLSSNLYEPAIHPTTGQNRITATLRLINNARNIVFIVTGASKAEMVARVLEKREGWEALPAAHVQASNGKLLWLLDVDSASLLG